MLNQFDPTVRATIKFLQLLKVKVNDATVNDSLQNHPDWPSLLCVTDTLTKWNVPNAAGAINPADLDKMPTPFLARIDDIAAPLAVVVQVSETEVSVYHGVNQKLSQLGKADFTKQWNGIYLIAEPVPESGESNYQQNKQQSFFKRLVPGMALAGVSILLFLLINRVITAASNFAAIRTLSIYGQYLILLVGLVVAILLVWYEIDQNNPLLKRVCSGLVKNDCKAIITGKQSKVFSWLSWSEVGLFFFAGSLLTLLFGSPRVDSVLSLVAWINILALPYTVFSVYYQGMVARQWCVLCLAVQVLLLAGGMNALLSGFLTDFPAPGTAVVITGCLLYLVPVLAWFSIKPYVLRLQQAKNTQRQFLRLKFNTEIFDTLLKKQKSFQQFPDNIGIELGNPNASNTIVKVCSTYCGPCSKAHPEIEKLLEAHSNLKVRIIFTAQDPEFDPAIKPIRHLLAIAEKENTTQLKQALNDWYLPDDKDYDRFAARYPMNGELLKQTGHIAAMNDWCNATGITYTPTIFINGFELPNAYDLQDLNYFLLGSEPVAQDA